MDFDFETFDESLLDRTIALQEAEIPPSEIPLGLSPEQYWAANAILANPGISFLTGGAGTGKSRLLKYLVEEAPWQLKAGLRVAAPTGTAALAVGGYTIHSLFGIQVWNGWPKRPSPDNPRRGGYNPNLRLKVLRSMSFLIVDEVSMVRADIMDTMDRALRNAKNNNLPFGGIKVLLVGDPFQLPPVQDSKWKISDAPEKYGKGHFFQSDVIRRAKVFKLLLKTVHRQKDSEFSRALNLLRVGKVTPDSLDVFNSAQLSIQPPAGCLVLFPKNKPVSIFNAQKLEELPGKKQVFWASRTGTYSEKTVNGDFKKSELDDPLELKVGAQVMFMKNDDQGAPKDADGLPIYRWTNGTLGSVDALGPESVRVRFTSPVTNTEVVETIGFSTWEDRNPVVGIFGDITDELVGTFTQIPLRLAWGATIHKAQGATYDRVHLDLRSGTFESGHAYVAMSRVRSLAGLSMSEPFNKKNINPIDSDVVEFMDVDSFFEFPVLDYSKEHSKFSIRHAAQQKREQAKLEKQRAREQIKKDKQRALEEAAQARQEAERLEALRLYLERRNKFAKDFDKQVASLIATVDSEGFGGSQALIDLILISPKFASKHDPQWTSWYSRHERWIDILTGLDASRFESFAIHRVSAFQDFLKDPKLELNDLNLTLSLGRSTEWYQFTSASRLLRELRDPAKASSQMRQQISSGSLEVVNQYATILREILRIADADASSKQPAQSLDPFAV